jgi:hypothetical protein
MESKGYGERESEREGGRERTLLMEEKEQKIKSIIKIKIYLK